MLVLNLYFRAAWFWAVSMATRSNVSQIFNLFGLTFYKYFSNNIYN